MIIDIDKNDIHLKLENGREMIVDIKKYNYVTYGYAITDYKSQGQTAKNVIYHADTSKLNFNQAYVGITRGKQKISIYTDDKQKFNISIKQEQVKTSTLKM